MEERRSARVGTVSGLALLAGGTAIAAAGGGTQSFFATTLLGLLTVGLGHSLAVEIKRQARRRTPGGWSHGDTVNTVLLGVWAEMALCAAVLQLGPMSMRLVTVTLAVAYATGCGYFVTERRRTIATPFSEATLQDAEPAEAPLEADGVTRRETEPARR